jgi:transposase InsO family protein
MPAFGSRSEKAMFVNHYWELDGTPADVVCSDGKRWSIVGLIDIHTRRVALNLEETNTSYAVARNLRHGLLKLGVPENVVIDNGKDYTSEHMESCFVSLGINAIRTPPYSGEYKPHIERFFGTLARQLFREMEGFLGHNVSEREKIKSSLSFGDKLKAVAQWREKMKDEENFVKLWKKGKMYAGLEIEIPLSSEELEVALESYVEMYENTLHSGIGMTPMQKYAKGEANRIVSDRSLDFLLGESKMYRVRKDGIQIVEDGVKFVYMANELYEYVSQQVRIVKLEKLDEIAVYDSDNELICVAVDPTYSGRSREQFKVAAKRWKRAAAKADKAVKEATRLGREKDMTIMDRLNIDRVIQESGGVDVESCEVVREELNMSGERPMIFKDMVDMFEWMALHPDEWRENDKLIKEENEELYESIEKRVRFSRRAS